MFKQMLLVAVLAMTSVGPALAEDIPATVVKVRDGDTVTVRLEGEDLPDLFRVEGVRFLGCDTPEKRDKRPAVAAIARAAREYTAARLKPGQHVLLRDARRDKYGGRVVARIEIDGVDLCRQLIDAGLARPYTGKGKKPW